MSTFDELNRIEDTYPIDPDETTETDVLSEGTVSSKLLSSLIALSRETECDYAFQRGRGGTEHYTLDGQTAVLRQHVTTDNRATLILSQSDLNMPWWKKITDNTLSPSDVIVE